MLSSSRNSISELQGGT